MESATELLFSQANKSAELQTESHEENPIQIPKEPESKEIPKELKETISSVDSGINSLSLNSQNESKDDSNANKPDNSKKDFFFPIINTKATEESKNSIADIPLTSNKSVQDQSQINFSSLNLKIPSNIKSKSNMPTSQKFPMNMNTNSNFPLNWSQYYVPNFFLGANPYAHEFFGKKFFENSNLSNFIPLSISCSLDTHNMPKSKAKSLEQNEFFEKIIKIADVSNVTEFWEVFQHLKKPNQCPIGTDYHIFKKGIIPMWEDDNNKNGGKLSVLLTWKYANVIWEEVTFNLAKGLLPHFEYINGIVISMRPKFVVLSFWIKTNNNTIVEKIRNAMSVMIQAPSTNCIDFIPFN